MKRASVGSAGKSQVSDMRHRITVTKTSSESKDETGQVIRTTANRFADEPAAARQVSGGETIRGRQVEAGVVMVFTVNDREGYDTTDTVVFNGESYGIHRIHRFLQVGRFLDLHCKASQV